MTLRLRSPDGHDLEIGAELILEEAREYHLVAPSASGVRLAERELERDRYGWRLPVGLWVGTSTLLVLTGGVSRTLPVRVIPASAKFDVDAWTSMLEALEAWVAGVSTGLAGGKGGAVGNSGVLLPLLTESLLALVPELERSVRAIVAAPKVRPRERVEERPLHRVQAASRAVLGWLQSHPSAAQYLDARCDAEVTLPAPRVPVIHAVDDVDHRVNRYMAWLIGRVAQQLRQCAASWRRHAGGEGESALWARLRAQECERRASIVSSLLATPFFRALRPEQLSEGALLVIGNDPVYARAHRLARLLLSPMFNPLQSGAFGAPVRDSYSVYELWTFVEVQRQLARSLAGASWAAAGLEQLVDAAGTGSGARYQATLPSARVIDVEFNPTFRSHWSRGQHPRWSLSKERRPDLVISASGGGRAPRWLFLDAKYRVAREALGEAFESVHIYRDALRDERHGGACVAGALLAPRQLSDTAAWFSKEYRDQHRCGVFELAPQTGADVLVRWVLHWLDCEADAGGAER